MSSYRDHIAGFTKAFVLDRERVALVTIDMQYASASRSSGLGVLLERRGTPEYGAERFDGIEAAVPVIQSLQAAFRRDGLPVIHVTFGAARPDFGDLPLRLRSYAAEINNRVGEREHEILDELRPDAGEVVLRKTTISAFASTGIESLLRTIGRDQVVLTGVSTNSCVDTTGRDASDRGFDCVLATDACAATTAAFHEAAIATFQRLFGRVATASEILKELASPGAETGFNQMEDAR